jgi:hypothetical protein
VEHSAVPDTIANQSPDAMHIRASDTAHQQIVRLALPDGAKWIFVGMIMLTLGVGVAIGLAVQARDASWDANREGRIAQSHIDEIRREIVDPLKARVDVLAMSPPTLIIKETSQCPATTASLSAMAPLRTK